jgi:hypothetical protein
LENVYSNLLAKVTSLDVPLLNEAIKFYGKNHEEFSLDIVRQECLNYIPELIHGDNLLLIDFSKIISDNSLLNRDQFSSDTLREISAFKAKLYEQFPDFQYSIRYRVSSLSEARLKLANNGVRALFDLVGFQIVPKSLVSFRRLIHVLNDVAGPQKMFVFNTHPFNFEDFLSLIGPSSSPYYRAIHYYFNIGGASIEVQVRLPATDQWAILHHVTCYKPIVSISSREEKLVQQLGLITNWVDYYQLIRPP